MTVGKRFKRYACPVCPERFDQLREKRQHIRAEHRSGERPDRDGEWEGDDLPTPDEALRMGWSV